MNYKKTESLQGFICPCMPLYVTKRKPTYTWNLKISEKEI